jgi:EAL domain-containing protein (putative c-di-GMP-specific phosphodiesterase class I)/GGDEF domain-containing protein
MESTPTSPATTSVAPPAFTPKAAPAPAVAAAAPEARASGKRGRKPSRGGKPAGAANSGKATTSPKTAGTRSLALTRASNKPRPLKAAGAPERPFELPGRDEILAMVGFVAAYLLLAIWGLTLADADGVTPWYPAVGLVVGAVALGGSRWLAPTAVASLIGGLLHPSFSDPVLAVSSAVFITAGYGGAGLVLRAAFDPVRPLTRVTDAWWFIGAAVVAAPIAVAAATLAVLAIAPYEAVSTNLGHLIRTFVLGDSLGIASVAPALIVTVSGYRRFGLRGALPTRDFLKPEALVAIFALIALTPVVYLGGGEDLRAVAALPLCWLALRYGVAGAVLGAFTWAASSALILAGTADTASFAGLQAFLLTGTMLAVIVGAVVSERGRIQRDLRHLAMHDQPSGLPNEPHLLELLDRALVEARGREVTTLIIRFAGLRQVAAALSKKDTQQLVASLSTKIALIAGDTAQIARPGFDRFAVLVTGAGQERRQQIADELIQTLHQPLAVESREVFVDPRVGITVGLPGEAADVVLAHAVHAADVAAGADGQRIGYYDATLERAHRERQELTEDLRVATEKGEFLLAFQPIVTAREGTVVAAEALLRWVDKKRGAVSPMDFVPVAEETGLILPIGRWVLNEACRRATTWPHVAGRAIDVSVNVSPIQLMDEGFVDDVAEALRLSGLPANRLRVEITEGIVLEDIERTILRINQLREMGVETMLDDFGTGHSSLAWVQRLPVSCIKIDRAFVNDVAVDGIDRAIVHASLYLSRALGTETVAEGVETEAQREQLIRMGCQKLQGYLFARPQPADVFPDFLAKQRAGARAGAPAPVAVAPAPRVPSAPAAPMHAQAAATVRPSAPTPLNAVGQQEGRPQPMRMNARPGVHAAPMPGAPHGGAAPQPMAPAAPAPVPAHVGLAPVPAQLAPVAQPEPQAAFSPIQERPAPAAHVQAPAPAPAHLAAVPDPRYVA